VLKTWKPMIISLSVLFIITVLFHAMSMSKWGKIPIHKIKYKCKIVGFHKLQCHCGLCFWVVELCSDYAMTYQYIIAEIHMSLRHQFNLKIGTVYLKCWQCNLHLYGVIICQFVKFLLALTSCHSWLQVLSRSMTNIFVLL
jgi:hypothetical protein